jgi:hypothetical protein
LPTVNSWRDSRGWKSGRRQLKGVEIGGREDAVTGQGKERELEGGKSWIKANVQEPVWNLIAVVATREDNL